MPTSPSLAREKKQHWWLSNRKVVDKYIRESRTLIATKEPSGISDAVGLLDASLALSPHHEAALELRARSLLFLRRFREVADMLQEYIPSYKMAPDDDSSNSLGSSDGSSSHQLSRERAKLLSKNNGDGESSFRCFSVSDLKRKVMAGLWKNREKEGHWRYLILGQACYHLGLMEDAMVLLQTGRRLATAASRRESVSQSDDNFVFSSSVSADSNPSESESASRLLSHIKLLLRRRASALAALDAGIPSEAVRHFSKILDGRRGCTTPAAFASSCFVSRAAAYRAAGRLAESIADCNRALAIDPASIPALRARADVLESVRAIPDCLRDLDHLKLLYELILRDRKLPGPAWWPHCDDIRYRDVPSRLRAVAARIGQCRQRVASGGEGWCNADYYAIIGVARGCARSELERAHVLLSLRHKPEEAAGFVDRLEFGDEQCRDVGSVREQARMSALILDRMLQKGYSSVMSAVRDDEAATAERRRSVAALQQAKNDKAVCHYQGRFCRRDVAAVGSMLSGFQGAVPVN